MGGRPALGPVKDGCVEVVGMSACCIVLCLCCGTEGGREGVRGREGGREGGGERTMLALLADLAISVQHPAAARRALTHPTPHATGKGGELHD